MRRAATSTACWKPQKTSRIGPGKNRYRQLWGADREYRSTMCEKYFQSWDDMVEPGYCEGPDLQRG